MKSAFLIFALFASITTTLSASKTLAADVKAEKNVPPRETIVQLERISQLNAQEMYLETSHLLNKYGWEGWGHHHYDFGNYTDVQMVEKRTLFDNWAKGDDFTWVDPIWSFSGHDPKVKAVLNGCDSLQHRVAANTRWEERPPAVSLPIEIGIGPIAIYPVNEKASLQEEKKERYVIVLKFNEVRKEYFLGEKAIETSKSFFSSYAFLYDLKTCTYTLLADLGSAYFGGYNENSIPRLTGVGYHNNDMVLYNIQDISPAYVRNDTTELHADLYYFDLDTNKGANHTLKLFHREKLGGVKTQ